MRIQERVSDFQDRCCTRIHGERALYTHVRRMDTILSTFAIDNPHFILNNTLGWRVLLLILLLVAIMNIWGFKQ